MLPCIALLFTLAPLGAEETFLFNSTPGNLPKDIVPRRYSIEVRPDVGSMKTAGSETITLEVQSATNQIVLKSEIAPQLSEEDRFSLVNDCWSSVQVGRAEGSALLKLITNLKGDRSVIVCGAMWNVFGTIDRLETERRRPIFRAFARSVFRPVFDGLGWKPQEGESQDTAKLRSDLIWYLWALGDKQVQGQGCEQFESYLRNPEALDRNLRCSIFCCVGAAGSKEQYEKLKELAKKSPDPVETQNAVTGLASTSDPKRANALFTWALQGNLSASNTMT